MVPEHKKKNPTGKRIHRPESVLSFVQPFLTSFFSPAEWVLGDLPQ